MNKTKSQVQRTLESVSELRGQVQRIRAKILELEGRCAYQTGSYGVRLRGSGLTTEEVWALLSDERERLSIQLEKLLQLERLIELRIDSLPRSTWRLVLRYRYLDNLSFGQIRERLLLDTNRCYSNVQIYRIHRAALEALEAQWDLP